MRARAPLIFLLFAALALLPPWARAGDGCKLEYGASGGDATFDWPVVDRGDATLLIFNNCNKPRTVKVSLESAVGGIQPPTRAEPESLTLEEHQSGIIKVIALKNASGERIPYAGAIRIRDDQGAATLLSLRLKILPEPLSVAATKISGSSMNPLRCPWAMRLDVPLANDTLPTDRPKPGDIVGVLQSDEKIEGLPVRFIDIDSSKRPLIAQLVIDPMKRGRFSGDVHFDAARKKELAVTVSIQGRQNIAYALFVIMLGIGLAMLSRIYLTTWRVLWLIKRQAEDIPSLVETAAEKFHERAPSSRCDPKADLRRQYEEMMTALDTFKSSQRLLSDNRTWFDDRLKELKAIESQSNDWVTLGEAVEGLEEQILRSRNEVDAHSSALGALWIIEAQFAVSGGPVQGADLAKAIQTVHAWLEVGRSWIAVYRFWVAESKALQDDDPRKASMQSMEMELFCAASAAGLTAVTARIYALLQHQTITPEGTLDFGSPLSTTGSIPQSMPVTGMPSQTTAAARRTRLRIAVRYGDLASFLFGAALAVFAALNASYFGQPFGSFHDYLVLFVSAATTKAVVDLAAMLVDKFAGVMTARTLS